MNDAKIYIQDIADFLEISPQAIHKKIKDKNLPYTKKQHRILLDHSTTKELINIKVKKTIFAFQIVKGGTGKTTLLFNLALRLNLYGLKILCIDIDQQANLTRLFKIDAKKYPTLIDWLNGSNTFQDCIINLYPGMDLLPSRIENATLDNVLAIGSYPIDRIYRENIAAIKKNYDFIFIYCPPSLGQSVAAATLASNCIISPVTPEDFSIEGLAIIFNELNNLKIKYKKKPDIKIILNKHDIRTTLSNMIFQNLIRNPLYGKHLFSSYIRLSQEFPNTTIKKTTIFDSVRATSASEDIDIWSRELIKKFKD